MRLARSATTSLPAALLGAQRPRLSYVPPGCEEDSPLGEAAVQLARAAGLHLDDWQQWMLCLSLSEDPFYRWVAAQVLLVVPRQNGKGSILEARELVGLFLLDERTIIHTAHELKTATRHRKRLEKLIKGVPELNAQVKRYNHSHGQESIELHVEGCSTVGPGICDCAGGKTIEFIARSKGSGRGFDGDLVVLDECMYLSDEVMEALAPTLSSKDNPQIWFTGSSADDDDAAKTMRKIRALGLAESRRLAAALAEQGPVAAERWAGASLLYAEWSVPRGADKDDRANWAIANPSLGIRMRVETIENERTTLLSDESFGKERLGMWGESSGEAVISMGTWAARTDKASTAAPPFGFAVAVDSAGERAAVGAASRRPDGLWHVELIEALPRTDWVPDVVQTLRRRHRSAPIVVRPASGAGPVARVLSGLDVKGLVKASVRDYQQACVAFERHVLDDELRHLDDPLLAAAVEAGRRQERDDAWIWDRDSTDADITPLEAVTLALHGLQQFLSTGAHVSDHVPTDPTAFVDTDAGPMQLRW